MVFIYVFLIVVEPEIYLCNPVYTPYGLVLTNNYYNSFYLLRNCNLEEIFTAPGCARYYTISWDKRYIGFKWITEDGLQRPALYDLETGDVKILHEPTYQAGQVSFSLDEKIAFTIGEELIVNHNGEAKRYSLGVYANLSPISPDGNFAVYNDNQDQLWLLNLRDNSRICITNNRYSYFYPEWSPDSRFIVYSTLGGFIKVYDRIENCTYEIDEGNGANWSKDSKYLIYYKTYSDGHTLTNSELFISKYDGSEKIQLTHTPDIFEMEANFIDSKKIIYYTFGRLEIIQAEIENNRLINQEILFRNIRPLKINYYNIISDFGSRDSIDVPYVHQVYDTPDWHNGHWSCAPTTAIMAIVYYRKLPYWDCWCSYPYGHTSHFGNYICSEYNYREVTYNWVAQDPSGNNAWGGYGYMWYNGYSPYSRMYYYLINHNLNSWVDDTPTWEETQAEVAAGWPYCMCVGLTSAGHLVLAVGQVLNWHTLIFNDPYGNKNTPGYPSYDGKYARYDWPGYNNGYQNLNAVYWCRGARGSWPPAVDTIVDDLQIRYPDEPYGFYMYTGSPSTMRFYHDNLSGYNGHFWWTYTTTSADTCYVTWTPHLPVAGSYEVFAYIPSINATANARYKIYYAGGNQTVTINQNNYSNQWVSLGTFPFNTTGGYVYLGDASGTAMQKIAFDALRWHFVGQDIEECQTKNIKENRAGTVVKERFVINLQMKNEKVLVSLYNSAGRLIKKIDEKTKGDGTMIIDVSDCSSGVYFIKFECMEKTGIIKFIAIRDR
ncbi:MAG: T9SS type A sorting domain-containing protein [candidate division WOR-3 bacterium]